MYKKITYRAGNTLEVIKTYARGMHPPGARTQSTPRSREDIEKANRIQKTRKLNRILNANFKKGDMYYTLTYKRGWKHPETEEELLKEIGNHLRRLRDRLKRQGIELKYVYVYSMGKSGNNPHVHIIANIPYSSEEHQHTIRQLWIKPDATLEHILGITEKEASLQEWTRKGELTVLRGFVKFKPMDENGNYMALAVYLIGHSYQRPPDGSEDEEKNGESDRDPDTAEQDNDEETIEEAVTRKRRKYKKAFEHSRNCVVPQPKVEVIKAERFSGKVTPIKGYYIQPGSVYKGSDRSGWPYIRYTLIKIPVSPGKNAAFEKRGVG